MTDIKFNLEDTTINLRVGALIRHDEQVLLCRLPDQDWWFLPGGRIAVGETSFEALARELSEELQGRYTIKEPVLSTENFFKYDDRSFQEYCTYYNVQWDSDPQELSSDSHEEFRWVTRADLHHFSIKPDFLGDYLFTENQKFMHVVHKDV